MTDLWYVCPLLPPEWIAAHGVRPRRMRLGAHAPARRGEGRCPYAEAVAASGEARGQGDLLVTTTLCDQMRRAAETVPCRKDDSAILLHMPSTWQDAAAWRLYEQELDRLSAFLVARGGARPQPDRLAEEILAWHVARRRWAEWSPEVPARAAAEAWRAFLADPPADPKTARFGVDATAATGVQTASSVPGGAPVALVGGPMRECDLWVLDAIESAGGRVGLDATEGARLTWPAAPDRRALREDPLAELVRMYFGHVPHPSRRPNVHLFRFLREALAGGAVRGVLLVRCLWCDVWHAEAARIRREAPCPVVELDLADGAADGRAATRIQSLIEVIS